MRRWSLRPHLDRAARLIEAFFFTPASARPLAALRLGVAAVLLAQVFLLRGDALEFLAHDGIVQGKLAGTLRDPDLPTIEWLTGWLGPLGVSEAARVYAVCGLYIASLLLLGAGLFTRVAAVAAWFLHWTLISTTSTTSYGADLYAHVFLFYLMVVPAGRAWSLDVALGRVSSLPSAAARLGLRVVQIHLCISYLASGIEKAVGPQWWNGELLWRAFSLPVYQQFDMSWLASYPWLSRIGGWGTLLVELGYCVFIWPRRTRWLWIAAVVGLHLGIAIFLGLGIFGAIMTVLTVAVFGVSAEARRSGAGAAR